MTLSAKTVIFDISVYMDFDYFLSIFWIILGPKPYPKSIEKQLDFDERCYSYWQHPESQFK